MNFVTEICSACGPRDFGYRLASAMADLASHQGTGHATPDHADVAAFALLLDRVDRLDDAAIGANKSCPRVRRW